MSTPVSVVDNPRALAGEAYPDAMKRLLSHERGEDAFNCISRWPGYAPTPTVQLANLAHAVGIAEITYKDEGGRFGLGSFKALGGALAVEAMYARIRADADVRTSGTPIFASATDGNHGRAVAWGAQRVGCRCVIYLHAGVSPERERAIAALGAEIRRVDGNYDDSVRQAQDDSARNGWIVISDTSYGDYRAIPCQIMQGYTVLARELLDCGVRPTHVFVQGGVGGLAAAMAAHFWEEFGPKRPRLVVVEPENAACLARSAAAGRPVVVKGALDTIMAGLACGEVSEVAWEILDAAADHFVTLPDQAAIEGMRLLALNDPVVVAGESATAGLAACLIASGAADLRKRLGLSNESRVLCIGTEGATDPHSYERLVRRRTA
ncbi:diaminopropionate ammonia-lyase [Sphingomonas sp. MAH-20]|uniref:Diaminopropionate ammonia-lyase n=1 Tax=Sphingomonas horti TaxID=2682842 RepID=A0A6I4J0S8_9SPHN|nr:MULTISPECIES: diaminopropionate ammonia-lyase [Sphingomonas]MBA2920579.1 diaminopropionate ammonia-lyase [Sphingomonas sp. CGMCC 1.13658]MVO78170.1 diaminopropionate ammonia-lyase [Sphingomonas horti]